MHNLVDIILGLVDGMWYTWIFIMMMIESSFIPFPSEVAMIPAGYLSSLGRMNLYIAFLAGTLGAMTWASINYLLWRYLWKPVITSLIHRYGKYILLNEKHYIQSELYFEKHGGITTLIGRFIPAVRQLISIPAGIFKMNFWKFLFYTTLWAGTWNAILLGIGYIAGKNDDLIRKLTSEVMWILLLVLWSIIIIYVQYVKKHKKELQTIETTIEHNDEVLLEESTKKMPKTPPRTHSK